MVRGIDSFREWFRGFEEQYAIFTVTSVADTVAELEKAGISCEQIRLDAYTGKPMTFSRIRTDCRLRYMNRRRIACSL